MVITKADVQLSPLERALAVNKKVLTFDEACLYTGYKPSYFYKLTSSGKVPFSKPNGKKIFFNKEKLDEWMLSNGNKTAEENEAAASTYVATH